MLKVNYRLKLGQDEFEISAEVKDEKEFFESMSFYSNLPRTAPGGSEDLKLTFRTTTEGHKYYSLVSEKEKMEFKFGQNKENQGGGLFPKGWSALYQSESQQTSAPVAQSQQRATIAPAPRAAAPISAPVQMPTPTAAPITPTAATPTPATPANPNVAAVANNVLARFGIQK